MTVYASISEQDDDLSLTSDYHDSDTIERGSVCQSLGKNSPRIGKGKLLQEAASVVKSRVGGNSNYLNRDSSDGAARNDSMSQPFALSTTLDNDEEEGGEGSSNDPYFVVRDDLIRQLSLAEESVTSYIHVVEKTDSAANSHEVKEKKKIFKRHFKHAESTIKDLESTIDAVECNRDQFASLISDEELQKRKLFVYDMKERIRFIKDNSNSEQLRQKIQQDERALADRRKMQQDSKKSKAPNQTVNNQQGASNRESTSSLLEKGDSDFAQDEDTRVQHMQAQEMLKQQDATLDDLDHAVVRVGQMAGNIHDEIQSQNKMLTDMEEDLTDAEEKLGMVMGKLAKLLKTKNKCQLGTILILSATVVILFFLVLYT